MSYSFHIRRALALMVAGGCFASVVAAQPAIYVRSGTLITNFNDIIDSDEQFGELSPPITVTSYKEQYSGVTQVTAVGQGSITFQPNGFYFSQSAVSMTSFGVSNTVRGEIIGDRIFFTATSATTVTFTYAYEYNTMGGPYLTHEGSRIMYQANVGGSIRLNGTTEFYGFQYSQAINSGLDGGVVTSGESVRTVSFDVDAGEHFLDLTLTMSSGTFGTRLGDGADVFSSGSLLWGMGFDSDAVTFTSSALGIDYTSVVPEPASAGLLAGLFVSGVVLMRRRRRPGC